MSGGDTYTIIYLKLLLLSLKDSGKLYYDGVETDFIKEIALTIDESEDNVMVTVNYLVTQRLIEVISENDEYFLTEIPSLIGSETASTRRSRKYRKQKALQCNTNATLCNIMKQKCNGEIDIEVEKETSPKNILYGEYSNINLTNEQYKKLQDNIGDNADKMISKLSRYIKSSGKNYKDHYVTILNWYEQDKEKLTQKNNKILNIKSYSINYEDSDSL